MEGRPRHPLVAEAVNFNNNVAQLGRGLVGEELKENCFVVF